MHQLITRIDDSVHERLRARAMSEQRSMASLIAGILTEAAGARTDRAALRSRLSAAGLLVVPPGPRRVPSRSAALLGAGGSGHTVSTELGVQRSER